ncbi:sulfurtransferase TusA family protein [Paraferrimonas sedimenticola]|uniref:Transcriptional regulator n=1 Tax=Paraferrimonas sedimenticola TaxID=375674 RepID=A0AA37W026_9GAMM|nr:sulfurtransferase TusA family protein [Paraferrimonas sedimenticola]GLP94768.1 transcriptional regulator [Paraferrimonas sedimenticola]
MERLDLRSENCPIPLITVKLKLKQMAAGEQLCVLLSDPGSVKDVPRLLAKKAIPFERRLRDSATELTITKP